MSFRDLIKHPAFRRARLAVAAALAVAALTAPGAVRADGPVIAAAASTGTEAATGVPAGAPLPVPSAANPRLYIVGYTHLDTQWRWSYPQVINDFLKHTMEDNFRDFEKYPHYVFNFTGSNRYIMMKEYFPEDYAIMKKYIKEGRWFPAGSSVEEGDVNMPNDEAIIRQVLYGNQFFRREFGVASEEFMLPDCFGFQASLPSILAHCGIKGFMTQKLTWGSAVGIPFNLGTWTGPDGKSVVASLNPGDYNGDIKSNPSKDKAFLARVEKMGKATGVYVDYHLYGTGDRGGAVRTKSLENIEAAYTDPGPIKVISSKADQIFKDLTPAEVAKLPNYKGDLLLTWHSAGSPTSEAFVKRTNRKLEQLGSAAERAAVAANWLGSSAYPTEKIYNAWNLQLGAHFHDIMAGTALPKAYEYSWNNMILSLNQWAAVMQDSAGAVAAGMDTRTEGTPIVVYNPLSTERTDLAEVDLPGTMDSVVTVVGPDGKVVPSQYIEKAGGGATVRFMATVPSMGFATYGLSSRGIPAGASAAAAWDLKATDRTIENEHLKVTLNDAGDISSIIDKKSNREQLMAPTRLEFLHEEPAQYPAWNMDYEDRMAKPTGYVDGPCEFKIVENGPVRVAIQTIRHAQGSTFTQTYSLDAGAAGNSVRVNTHIDWHTQKCSLEAAFPLAAGAPEASYESAVGVIKRGNNNPKKYEVPQQNWFDVTDESGKFGTAILNDCKYASDKPDDHTVRLTLLYTPDTTKGGYQDQGTQDLGIHDMVYSIAPHEGSWENAGVPWTAARLNQPLMAFTTTPHEGKLGKTFEIGKTNKEGVSISALKKAEDSDETIVRLKELNGVEEGPTAVSFAGAILSAREVDGQEREIGPAKVVDGKLIVDMSPFSLRAFAIKLAPPVAKVAPVQTADVAIEYDTAGVGQRRPMNAEADAFESGADFDGEGHSYPADMLPPVVTSENIPFKIGPTTAGAKDVLTCKGQTITLPAGYNKVYFLAASTKGEVPAEFTVNEGKAAKTTKVSIQDWSGYIGQWDTRIWVGPMLALTYNWGNKFVGLDAGYIKRDTVAFYSDHRRDKNGGNGVYQFCYLYKYGIDLPAGATSITLPNDEHIKVFAVTVAKDGHDNVTPGRPLYDTLEDHVPAGPTISPEGGKFDDVTTMTMGHKTYGHEGDTHYTTDGSEPTEQSPVYKTPIVIDQPVTVRARQFTPRGPAGPEVDAKFDVNDTTAPTVKAASGLTQEAKATVTFSKAVAKTGAENVASYKFDPADEVTAAALSNDGTEVVLTLTKPLAEGTKLTITGVSDPSPNANKVSSEPIPIHVSGALATVDDFTGDGTNTKELKVPDLSGKKNAKWTINFFCKPDGDVPDLTPIAGFGSCRDGEDGKGRYICKFAEGVHFWACNQDVASTNAPVDVGAWQMLTASYDGKTLKLYKDGKLLESKELELADDNPTVRLAPADAWGENRHFKGKIHAFTVWPSALSDGAIEGLKSDMPK